MLNRASNDLFLFQKGRFVIYSWRATFFDLGITVRSGSGIGEKVIGIAFLLGPVHLFIGVEK